MKNRFRFLYVFLLLATLIVPFSVSKNIESVKAIEDGVTICEPEVALTGLTVEGFENNLSPVFSCSTSNYNLSVSSNIIDLNIEATPISEDSTVTITGNKYMKNNTGVIRIDVTNADETKTKTYTINYSKNLDEDLSSQTFTFGSTKEAQKFTTTMTGMYKIELWGAQGGHLRNTYTNGGAYTSGEIMLPMDTDLYFFVGEAGNNDTINPTFNGGGGGSTANGATLGFSGGGATDVRLYVNEEGKWNDSESLASRIMVAAGGGGAAGNTNYDNGGGKSAAGGLIGYSGGYYPGHEYVYQNGGGATQTLGGIGGINHFSAEGTNEAGAFGVGGTSYSVSGTRGAGGGGGGYYGGGAGGGTGEAGYGQGGGGGSSYISGHAGSIAIKAADDISPRTITDGENEIACTSASIDVRCSYHYSGYKFTNTTMIDGQGYSWTITKGTQDGMPDKENSSILRNGNREDGFAKISMLALPSDDNYLTSIVSSDGTFDKTFDPLTDTYNLTLSAYTAKFTLSGTTSDSYAAVAGFAEYRLNLGETKRINIIVTSASGNQKTYKVIATRSESELTTSSTKLKSLTIDDGLYSVDFEPLVYSYDVDIAANAMELDINAVTFDAGASVRVIDNRYMTGNSGRVKIVVSKEGLEDTIYRINYNKVLADPELVTTKREFTYTGDVGVFTAPFAGKYKVQLWGGSGSVAAFGAYTEGIIDLTKDEILYVYVGNRATGAANTITFNGGTSDTGGWNGGGATDVRLVRGSTWYDFESLKSRIMVAAGGGAGEVTSNPGAAGGLEGYDGDGSGAGNQTDTPIGSYTRSTFGVANGGCTGGNGYYPGDGSACATGAGGGSSFISGHDGSLAISEDSTSSLILPTGSSIHYSGKKFTDTVMVDGKGYSWTTEKGSKTGMPSFDGTTTINGNNNEGHAIITATYVSNDNYLTDLTSNVGTWDLEFDPTILEYNLMLDKYEQKVTLSAETSDSNAVITGPGEYTLQSGETKKITLTITAPSGKTKDYVVNVTRPRLAAGEHNTKLVDLSVGGYDLDIPFTSLTYEYNIEITKNKYDLDITAIPYDDTATITITGNKYMLDDYSVIKIKVEAEGVEPTTYQIFYTKIDYSEDYFEYTYTGDYEEFVAPHNGEYVFELWGGAGGTMTGSWTGKGGRGGYTSGTLRLKEGDTFYVYVGGMGVGYNGSSSHAGGWNGGGTTAGGASGGGGATDIRLISGNWNDIESLRSRIMVAGGGGGSNDHQNGGFGGGLTAGIGVSGSVSNGGPGTQTSAGTGSNGGGFGYGGGSGSTDGGSGGGGYYGGGKASGNAVAGGGGSSYISGYTGSVAVKSATDSTPRLDSYGSVCANGTTDITCSYHYSGYVFTDPVMFTGNELMPNYTGTDRISGNNATGHAKIYFKNDVDSQNNYLDELKFRKIDYTEENLVDYGFDPLINEYSVTLDKYTRAFKLEGELSDPDARVTGLGKYTIEPGETKTITVTVTAVYGNSKDYVITVTRETFGEDEHTALLKNLQIDKYDFNEDFYTNKHNYSVKVFDAEIDLVVNAVPFDDETVITISGNKYISSSTGLITVTAKHIGLPDEIYEITYTKIVPSMDDKIFEYTGKYQTFKAPFAGKYRIETWGASGGGTSVNYHTSGSSGGMGGYAAATFKILKGTELYVYVGGQGVYGSGSSSYGGPIGGWNGGGNGGNSGSGSGGGATDVRMTPTSALNIWNETNSLYSRIIVAGAGGGSDDGGSYVGTYGGDNDGCGGSGVGLKGQGACYNGVITPSYAGTQTEGYALGQGAHVTISTDTGGAGGGYWGGLATNYGNGGGGAGSSYIKSYPGADTTYLEYQEGATYFNNSGEFKAAQNTGHGRAKISFLGIVSDNVYLSDLTVTTDLVQDSLIEEVFNPLEGRYTAYLDKYTELFYINGTLSDNNSTVTGLGEYRLALGETKDIDIVVTAETGNTKTYTIRVSRDNFEEGEHSTKLAKLSEATYNLRENFYSEKYDYRINVFANEIDMFWTYETYDPEAVVTVEGDKYIKTGFGTITFTVTLPEEYNVEPTVYEVVYTKVVTTEPSKNNYLKELTTSVGTLSPDFDMKSQDQRYTIHLDSTQTGTRLTGKVDDAKALVTGLDKFYKVEPGDVLPVDIVVTSDFGTTRNYHIDITRDAYDGATPTTKLKSLTITGYETDIDFQSDVYEYDIVIPKGEIDLTLVGIPYDDDAIVTVENSKHLVDDEGTITVTVTKSGCEDSVYQVNYTKYESYTEDIAYTGNYKEWIAPYTGIYTFELWGASGGRSTTDASYTGTYSRLGGAGGYTKGTINLEKGTTLYIYTGGAGPDGVVRGDTPGGYNGGGGATWDHSDDETAGAGGGATDIRLVKGDWNYNKSLASRIMVAAGGGGAAYNQAGGYAGGLVGEKAYYAGSADQVSGYAFGYGETGVFANTNVEVAGGGGGYYGGFAKTSGSNNVYQSSGGGGSSFISGHVGSVAISAIDDLTPRLDSNNEACLNGTTDITCSYHYSGYKFTDTKMIAGNAIQPTHDGGSEQTGNTGNGFAKVSMELSQDAYLQDLTSDYGVWDDEFDPLQFNYNVTLNQYEAYLNLTGTLSNPNATVTNLDKMYELALGETRIISLLVTAPNGDTQTYTVTIHRENYTDVHSTKLQLLSVVNYEEGYLTPKFTPIKDNYDITIDSSEAEIHVDYVPFDESATITTTGEGRIIAENGVVTVKVSAEGCEDTLYTITYKLDSIPEGTDFQFPFTGSYQTFVVPTTGIYDLEVWGSQGGGRNASFDNGNLGYGGAGGYSKGSIKLYKDQVLYVYVGGRGTASNDSIAYGGFNGGGAAWGSGSSEPAAGGGGATDIRTELNNLYTRFIVAGGGAGGGEDSETGGVGGGTTGGNGGNDCYGTQTAGRCGAVFGYGASTPNDGGGGGGGWYGGGTANGSQTLPTGNNGSDTSGGSGGSGFVYTSGTSGNVPSGYRLDEKWYLTDATTIAGNAAMPTIDHSTIMYGKSGDGYALITLKEKVSRNNYLVNISSDYGTLTPTFETETQVYDLHLDAYTPKFTLSARAADEGATISGVGTYSIAPGATRTINVNVTASAGDIRTYRVNVTRDEFTDTHSSLLSNLTINNGLEEEIIPGFNSKVYNYDISIYYNLTDLIIGTETYDEDAIVKVYDNYHIGNSGTVTIKVNCPESTETVYRINYTKDKTLEGYIPKEGDVVTEFEYTGNYQTFVAPDNGDYIIELWGAQGNHANRGRSNGGKGAYTYGIINLQKDEKLYVYVGEHRNDRSASFNAGTTGGSSSDTTNGGSTNGYGGGGATDVRLVSGTWSDAASLRSRIMVAAGGGGASDYAYPADGGAAGALVGFDGKNGKYPGSTYIANTPPTGATQTNGGVTTRNSSASVSGGAAGGFGTGGNGQSSWGSAGGGGYWNGAGGGHSNGSVDSGAGGSSFISGYLGSVAIISKDSTTARNDQAGAICTNGTTDITCSYHYSNKIFTNTKMSSGQDKMPNKTGDGNTSGNAGSGYARITQILKDEDNYLQTLVSSYGDLKQKEDLEKGYDPTKGFDPLVYEYTLTLGQYDTSFTLSGTLSNDDATVTGLGYYEIDNGETLEVPIVVTSESGVAKTYTIIATRSELLDEHTTKLKELRLLDNEGINPPYGLNEEFNSLKLDYTANLYYNVIDLTINTVTYDPTARVQLIDNLYITEDEGVVKVRVYIPDSEVADTIYTINYSKDSTASIPDNYTYNYTGKYETWTAPYTGAYQIEVWGANGGGSPVSAHTTGSSGGLGGYAKAVFTMPKNTNLYIYAGGAGWYGGGSSGCGGPTGGWNGGGNGGNGSSGSGGGATDVRLTPTSSLTVWNETESLYSRIIVAGGAGGADNAGDCAGCGDDGSGGSGAGLSGQGAWVSGGYNAGYAGTQTSGYALGQGGHVTNCTDTGGAGGGYYGGTVSNHNNGGAGAGSSYIKNYPGADTRFLEYQQGVEYREETGEFKTAQRNGNGYAVITPLFYNRDYYLTDISADTIEDNVMFPEFDPLTDTYSFTMDKYDEWITINATLSDPDNAKVIGPGEYRLPNPGDELTIPLIVTAQSGEQKTYTVHIHRNDFEEGEHTTKLKDLDIVGSEDLIDPRFQSRIYEYDINISSGTIDMSIYSLPYDENAIVKITTAEEVNKIVGNDIYYVKDDTGTVYVTVSLPDEYVDEDNEDTLPSIYVIRYDKYGNVGGQFNYTGQYQTWTAPATGYYLLEAWGAKGSNNGGNGAYTAGNIYLTSGTNLYIYAGNRTDGMGAGWNGGGAAIRSDGFGGGGATDFRLVKASETKTVWNEITSLRSRIMVAAGGGGAITWSGGAQGGYGGALVGGSGANRVSGGSANTPATGGTQTTGGTIVRNGSGTMWSTSNVGTFGVGGTVTNGSGTNYGGGAGGGGYWGGASGNDYNGSLNSGAGGSSYISGHLGSVAVISEDSTSPRLDKNNVECTETSALNDITCSYHYSGYKFINTKMIAGNSVMPTTSGTGTMTGNAGNGYAKVTPLDRDNYLLSISVKVDKKYKLYGEDDEVTWDNVEGAVYTPEFDKFTDTYYLELPDHVTDLTLGARASSDAAQVDGLGNHEVFAGENRYDIVVTAESGEERTYTLVVTRPASHESRATMIDVTGFVKTLCKPYEEQGYCNLSPATFDPDTTEYYVTVPSGIRDLEWSVLKTHAYQDVIGAGVTRLGPWLNMITIEVESEYCADFKRKGDMEAYSNCDDVTDYTYYVTRDMTGDNYIDQLIINDPEIDINFDYLLTEYTFKIPNEYTELDMTVILDDPNATYEIVGNENFEVGVNIVEVVVTAANGEVRTYVLNVYRLANGNKLLSELHVMNGTTEYTLNPPFEEITTSYTLDLPNDVKSVNITATPAYNKTTVTGTGTYNLKTGLNQIHVISTAENGETETYTIVINRAKSDNAYLSILKALEGNFNETYVKTDNNYTMTVNPYVKKLNLNAIPEDETATVKITGNDAFKIGNNTVKVIVTAENGNTNTYTIVVTKEGSDINTLNSLIVEGGGTTYAYTPVENYTLVTVPNDVTEVSVSGTLDCPLSKVQGFETYRLTTGDNLIIINVTSETGITNSYTVNVFREYNGNNYLASLTVSSGVLNPTFDREVTSYQVNVPNEVEEIDVTGVAEVPQTSEVIGNGTYQLNVGENTITIKVKAESGAIKEYVITVLRDKSSNSNLSDLVIQEARLHPTFNPMIGEYAARVLFDIDTIHVIATPADPEATVEITGTENLRVGDNIVTVTVTAPDESQKEYTIVVTRLTEEESPDLYLGSLDVSGCTIDFNKRTYYYTCTVVNETLQTTIEATPEDEANDVLGTGTIDLKTGHNYLQVAVTDGEFERIYTVDINRLKSTESRLKNIIITDNELDVPFSPDFYEYYVTTSEYELDFAFVKMHEGTTIEVTGNDNMAVGENTITIRTTSEDGEHHTTYTIHVTRLIRDNNYLSNLWIEDYEITPEFTKEINNYKVFVPYEETGVIIGAEAEDRNATVEGTGLKTLIPGPNTATIRVRAEDGSLREYRITITRAASPNNYLESLTIEGETYTPEFNKERQNYSLAVPYETDTIHITAIPEDDEASIIGDGEVALKQGVNNVEVYVVAPNGNVRTYVIKVTRKDPITAKLLNIEVENYKLDPEFTPDNPLYQVTVDYETTKLNFIITKMDPYSTYEIVGNRNFKIGINEVYINVTSSNRIDTFQYKVIVNRQAYSNTFLSSLTVNQGELTPAFNKSILTYVVEVANGVEHITIDGSPDYPLSTVTGFGDYTLKVGSNQIPIVVTSPSGIKRTYNVIVNRKRSSNANITSIKANIGTLTKEDEYTYTLVVPKYTTNIGKNNFTVTTEDPTATVSMPVTIDLSRTTAYPIKVTSPDGTRTKEYTVNVVFDLSHDNTLADLIPSVGELNPKFDPKTNNYRIDLFDDEEEEFFDLYLNEVEATLLNRSLTYQLTELETEALISVQAEDGVINTYKVLIVKSLTKEKYVDNIKVTGVEEIAPEVTIPSFRSKTFDYEFTVPYEVESIGFDVTKRHPSQVVKVYRDDTLLTGESYSLNVGVNNMVVEIVNSLNEVTRYNYTITRLPSTNAHLASLRLTDPDIEIAGFERDIFEYDVIIPYENENITIEAIPEINGSRVVTNGTTNLMEGEERAVTITVTAPDNRTKLVYTLNVLREPEFNNLLRTLTISSGKIYTLNPKFRPGNMRYTLTVSSTTPSVHVDAIPYEDYTVASGSIGTVPLNFGDNSLRIVSTATVEGRDYVRNYDINIFRPNTNDALLENIIVRNGTMVEPFEKTNDRYTVNVDNDVTSLDLVVTTEDSAATYTVTGNSDLGYGKENHVVIKVLAADGETAKLYHLYVTVKGEANPYLSDLTVDGETVLNFNKHVEEYNLKVENAISSVEIDGTPESENATIISGIGRLPLEVGENTFDIVVEAQDGETRKTYTINITREEDAYLNFLATDQTGPIPGFEKTTYDYELTVENDIEELTIIGMADDANAEVTGNGKYTLKVGENPIYISVKNGSTRKVYTVNVTRKGSANTNLLYLTSTDGDLDPVFDNSIDEYVMHLPNYKTKLALAYEAEHNATVQVLNNDLSGEYTDVQLIVTAEAGNTRTINIRVYLEDGGYFNSRLANLEVQEGTIAPRFDPDTYAYTLTVNQEVTIAHIVATPEETTSVVTGDGALPLELGKNETTIVVTALDGSTTSYRLVVFRKDMDNADLTGLYTDIGELDPEFSPKVYNYTIDVPEETRKVHLTAVAYSEKIIVGDGDVYLHKGITTRNIIVTSESGITNTYVVNINRALSTNHDITNITESTGEMAPVFDPTTLEYNFKLGDVKTNLDRTYVATNHVVFDVTTYSELAEVIYERVVMDTDEEGNPIETRETLPNNDVSLNYGDNKFVIYAMSEDGNTSDEYVFNIYRIHDLTDITVPGDATGPAMLDGSPNHISVQPGGTFDLLSEITYTPEDADFKDLIFKSNNTSLVTINAQGIITAADVLDKSTTITVTSKYYPNIVKTVNVTVEITLISSEVYDVEREDDSYDPYIIGIELNTTIEDFVDNLDNDARFIRVYDLDGERITDWTQLVGTGYQVKLENNGHTYDTLDIVVIGDINGDAKSNATDYNIIKNYMLRKETLTGPRFLGADVTHDGKVNATDYNTVKNYMLRKISTYLTD